MTLENWNLEDLGNLGSFVGCIIGGLALLVTVMTAYPELKWRYPWLEHTRRILIWTVAGGVVSGIIQGFGSIMIGMIVGTVMGVIYWLLRGIVYLYSTWKLIMGMGVVIGGFVGMSIGGQAVEGIEGTLGTVVGVAIGAMILGGVGAFIGWIMQYIDD